MKAFVPSAFRAVERYVHSATLRACYITTPRRSLDYDANRKFLCHEQQTWDGFAWTQISQKRVEMLGHCLYVVSEQYPIKLLRLKEQLWIRQSCEVKCLRCENVDTRCSTSQPCKNPLV